MRWIKRVPLTLLGCLLMWSGTATADTTGADERILEAEKVGTDPAALLEHLRKRTAKDADADKVPAYIKDLGDDRFDVREKAQTRLIKLGRLAEPQLKEALKNPDVEIVRRSEECLRLIRSGVGSATDSAALRLLAGKKPADAAAVVLAYLPFAANHLIDEEVKTTLTALTMRNGKADAAVLSALTDKTPQRRAAAAVALCRAGGADEHKAVRALLQDADLNVRLQAALALTEARDKEAVPVLIELLTQLPISDAWVAEDMLFRIGQDKAPEASLGANAAARKKCRDAWAEWWSGKNAKVVLSHMEPAARLLGHTIVILLDSGIIQEMDAKGKVLWQLKEIQFPLDSQLLPGGERVLSAEHGGNLVTERDLKGKIYWEKELNDSPLVAQRLVNGNTFIALSSGLLEVDREGKEVYTYRRPLETIRRAMKLRNGDIAIVTSGQRYVRLSPDRQQELATFQADIRTNGGRIEVLPNGNVLVPLKDANRVVEYDPEGREVWEVAVDEPVAAVRLPNGHTLVTTLNQRRCVEFDGSAQEVWEYKSADSRVTRAWRR